MNRQTAATLPIPANYDDCRIISCLKKMFRSTAKARAETDFVVTDNIAAIKKELELLNTGAATELSYGYLAAMEQSIPGAAFRYLVIYKNSHPILFACFQLFTLTSKNFNLEKNKGFVKRILRFFLDLKKVSVLISGNALRNNTAGYCFNKSVLSADEATELIASGGEKIAADENAAALVLKDIPVSGNGKDWLAGAGFDMPWNDQVMTMDIDNRWETITDYLSNLSRKYKTRAKKIIASGELLTVKELAEGDIQHYQGEISRLFKNVADNQSFILTSPGKDHFSSLKKIYKENFEVIGFFRDKKLVAFYTAFVTSEDYELYYIGLDYLLNNEYQLYFNILFSGLGRAILLKKRQLKLGRTSFDAKASLGAKPVDMDYYYKPGNIPNVVSKWFSNYFSAMEDAKWKLRNPLK